MDKGGANTMTTLKEFERICENIRNLELAPNDLRADGDVNKPRVRAELDKLDIQETEDGLGDYMLATMYRWYYNHPAWPTEDHLERAIKYYEQAKAKGYPFEYDLIESCKHQLDPSYPYTPPKKEEPPAPPPKPFDVSPWNTPTTGAELEALTCECEAFFGKQPPKDYLNFLRDYPGCSANEKMIYHCGRMKYKDCCYVMNLNAGRYDQSTEYGQRRAKRFGKRYFFMGMENDFDTIPRGYSADCNYFAYDYVTGKYVIFDEHVGYERNPETGELVPLETPREWELIASCDSLADLIRTLWGEFASEERLLQVFPNMERWGAM
jgi:hypothetical protein